MLSIIPFLVILVSTTRSNDAGGLTLTIYFVYGMYTPRSPPLNDRVSYFGLLRLFYAASLQISLRLSVTMVLSQLLLLLYLALFIFVYTVDPASLALFRAGLLQQAYWCSRLCYLHDRVTILRLTWSDGYNVYSSKSVCYTDPLYVVGSLYPR